MSKMNGSDLPRCVPSSLPLTKTVASQSTASKWSSTRLPFHPAGTSNVAAIPEVLVLRDVLADAGERRLDRERHEDLPVPLLRLRGALRGDRVVPQAVEVLPVLADDLRPRVFLPGVLGRDLLAPLRHERGRGGLPVGGECGRWRRREAESAKRNRESMRRLRDACKSGCARVRAYLSDIVIANPKACRAPAPA